jgi:hypothetical protein
MYGEGDKKEGNPGPVQESDVDVMDETFDAAADEAFAAVKAGDVAGFKAALKEAIKSCM